MGASITPAGPQAVGGAFSASPPTPKQNDAGSVGQKVTAPPTSSAGGPPPAVVSPPSTTSAATVDAVAGANGGPTTTTGSGPKDAVNGAAGLPGLADILQQLTDLLTKLMQLISQMSPTQGGGGVVQQTDNCDMADMPGMKMSTSQTTTTAGGGPTAAPAATVTGGGAAAAPVAAVSNATTASSLHALAQSGGFPTNGSTVNPNDPTGPAVPNLDINGMFSNLRNVAF